MITVTQAKDIISKHSGRMSLKAQLLDITDCASYCLSGNIKAQCSSPSFDQSAMDGYVIFANKNIIAEKIVLNKNVEIRAGSGQNYTLKPNEAVRIFTGGKIPKNGNVVVPQENVIANDDSICVAPALLEKNANIRVKGSQFKINEIVLKKGEALNAAKIALAASAGYYKLPVIKKPSVAIIISGDELILPGKKLSSDSVYESNSYMLHVLLKQNGIEDIQRIRVKDNEAQITKAIKNASKKHDVLLISGGISVGKYDLIRGVLKKLKTKTLFYKIKQKPGKPLYFGKKENKYIFGLPGNPAASLTCFYEYVLPFLLNDKKNKATASKNKVAKALNGYSKKAGLTHFLKAQINDSGVMILPNQESYKLTSFAEANCLVVVPEQIESISAGESVECHLL